MKLIRGFVRNMSNFVVVNNKTLFAFSLLFYDKIFLLARHITLQTIDISTTFF